MRIIFIVCSPLSGIKTKKVEGTHIYPEKLHAKHFQSNGLNSKRQPWSFLHVPLFLKVLSLPNCSIQLLSVDIQIKFVCFLIFQYFQWILNYMAFMQNIFSNVYCFLSPSETLIDEISTKFL